MIECSSGLETFNSVCFAVSNRSALPAAPLFGMCRTRDSSILQLALFLRRPLILMSWSIRIAVLQRAALVLPICRLDLLPPGRCRSAWPRLSYPPLGRSIPAKV